MKDRDYKKDYTEFWKSIVENAKGHLLKDQVKRELSDYLMVLTNCTSAYSDMTMGNISKPNTDYEEVRGIFTSKYIERYIIHDDIKDALDECKDYESLKDFLEYYISDMGE